MGIRGMGIRNWRYRIVLHFISIKYNYTYNYIYYLIIMIMELMEGLIPCFGGINPFLREGINHTNLIPSQA